MEGQPSGAGSRHAIPWLVASGFYVGLTIGVTWPLTAKLSSVLPNDLGDPLLNTWILWWNAHATPLTARWWNAPIFWPVSGALAFSETLLGLAPLTTLIQLMGGSAITAYNIAFLLTFPLSALAMHGLVFKLTGRHDVATIGALIYGFNPFRVAHFAQIQVMASWWMPVAILGFHGYVDSGRARWLCVFGLSWLMQALSNGYYLLFFPVLAALWVLWFTGTRARLRSLSAVVGAWGLASVPLVPYLWEYRRILTSFGMRRDLGSVDGFGADLTSLLDASPLLKFWSIHRFHQPEGELFPGLTAVVLGACLVGRWLWGTKRTARVSRACVTLLLVALLFVGLSLSTVLIGPWAVRIHGVTLVSAGTHYKPLSIAVLFFLAALAFERRGAGAWRRRSTATFYVFATGLMYLLSFGPEPRFLGTPFMYKAPYGWLMMLPGYDEIRVPARFAMLAVLCLSVVAALSFARLTASAGRVTRSVLATVAILGVLADSWLGTMPLPALPLRLQTLESAPAGASVMELPLGEGGDDVSAMYRAMYHGRTLVNGYSGFFPRSHDVLSRALAIHDPEIFDAVTAWGPLVVAVDERHDVGGLWVKQLSARAGSKVLGHEAGRTVFLLGGGTLPPETERGERLAIATISANTQGHLIGFAVDGNPETCWLSGPQRGTEVVTIDLGSERTIGGLTMTIGRHVADFPRMLVIESSTNGLEWSTRWRGRTSVAALVGAVRHPLEVPLTFALPRVPARVLRLRQLGQDPVFYWSIFELAVYGR